MNSKLLRIIRNYRIFVVFLLYSHVSAAQDDFTSFSSPTSFGSTTSFTSLITSLSFTTSSSISSIEDINSDVEDIVPQYATRINDFYDNRNITCKKSKRAQIALMKAQILPAYTLCYVNASKIARNLRLNKPMWNIPQQVITEANVSFLLFTRKNTDIPYIFDAFNVTSAINSSTFDPSKRTVLYVEGALSSHNRSIAPFVNGVLPVDDVNIIIANWDSYAFFELTYTGYFTTFRLGPIVGKFMNLLINASRTDPKKLFFIGFSVGGQTVGLAAKTIQPRIGNLLAIDPQGYCFHFLPKERRVADTDADFVQMIHCSTGIFGAPPWHTGVATFYANGGYIQPECHSCNVLSLGTCSHLACGVYFLGSLYNLNKYIGVKCDTNFQFLPNNCNCSDTAVMGYATPITTRGKYEVKATLNGSTTCT